MDNEALAVMALGHLAIDGLDDIFKPPLLNQVLELEFLRINTRFAKILRRDVLSFLNNPRNDGFKPLLRLKVPKTRVSYRQASLIDVVDLVRFTALVAKIAPVIEAHRIPADLNIVFSTRYLEGIPFLSTNNGYERFRAESQRLSIHVDYNVKVITDISNFYDRLNIHRLQTSLTDIGCNQQCVDAIDQILMHWANRNSYGIPVGCDASRLLSEAMLIRVDNELVNKNIVFVRYVDDYRIFASNYAEAHSHLNILINALDAEGLFINSEKTRILDCNAEHETPPIDPNHDADFEVEDEKLRIPMIVQTRSRYGTRISTVYRQPGQEAIRKLRAIDIDALFAECMIHDVAEDRLRLFIKAFIYREDHNTNLLLDLVKRHIHLLGYTVSALIKENARLSQDVRTAISGEFELLYEQLSQTDYYRLCVARLLSQPTYNRAGVFGRWFGRLRPDVNPIFIRELIGFFRGTFTIPEIRQLVAYCNNAHVSVQRIITVVALECATPKGERQAWAKTWRQASNDPLINSICLEFLHGPE